MDQNKKKALLILSALWVPIAVLLILIARREYLIDQSRTSIPFDRDIWAVSTIESGNDSTRLRMVEDLIQSKGLVGMSRLETISLLGGPDWVSDELPEMLNWHMGFEGQFMGGVTSFLELELDDESLVVRVRIRKLDFD